MLGIYPKAGKHVFKKKKWERFTVVLVLAKALKIIPIVINKKIMKLWHIYRIE